MTEKTGRKLEALSRLRKVGSQGSLDNVCCFCQQPGDESVPGGLASLHATKPGSRGSTRGSLKYHEPCVGYSNSSLDLQHAIDRRADRGDRRLLLDTDVARVWDDCRAYVCAVCGKLGATVACCAGAADCSAWFHFPCARMAAQEGERGTRVTFDQTKRELACEAHAFMVGNPIVEPKGMWFEGSGGWNGGVEDALRAWEAAQLQRSREPAQQAQHRQQQQQQQQTSQREPAQDAAGQGASEAPPPSATVHPPAAQAAPLPPKPKGFVARWLDRKGKLQPAPRGGGGAAGAQGASAPMPEQGTATATAPAGSNGPTSALTSASSGPAAQAMAMPAAGTATAAPPIGTRPASALACARSSGLDADTGAVPAAEPGGGFTASGGGADRPPPADSFPHPDAGDHHRGSTPGMGLGQQQQQQQADGVDGRGGSQWDIPGHVWERSGCITRPVPLRPGEIRVMSHTIIAGLVKPRERVMCKYLELMQKNPAKYPRVRVISTNIPDQQKRIKVERSIQSYLAGKSKGGLLDVKNLPSEVAPYEHCEVFDIAPDDPRVALARQPGAKGWRNARFKKCTTTPNDPIPPYTVLGAYQSLQVMDSDFRDMARDKELRASMGFRNTFEMRLQLDSYGADSSAKDDGKAYNSAQRKLISEELKLGALRDLAYSAYGYGNETALINDFFLDPITEVKAKKANLTPAGSLRVNCRMVEATVYGWPYLFLVTDGEPVAPQEELITTYEEGYWKNINDQLDAMADQEEDLQHRLQWSSHQPGSRLSGEVRMPQVTAPQYLVTQGSGVHAAAREQEGADSGEQGLAAHVPQLRRGRATSALRPGRLGMPSAAAAQQGGAGGTALAAEDVVEVVKVEDDEHALPCGPVMQLQAAPGPAAAEADEHSPISNTPIPNPFAAAAAAAPAARPAAAAGSDTEAGRPGSAAAAPPHEDGLPPVEVLSNHPFERGTAAAADPAQRGGKEAVVPVRGGSRSPTDRKSSGEGGKGAGVASGKAEGGGSGAKAATFRRDAVREGDGKKRQRDDVRSPSSEHMGREERQPLIRKVSRSSADLLSPRRSNESGGPLSPTLRRSSEEKAREKPRAEQVVSPRSRSTAGVGAGRPGSQRARAARRPEGPRDRRRSRSPGCRRRSRSRSTNRHRQRDWGRSCSTNRHRRRDRGRSRSRSSDREEARKAALLQKYGWLPHPPSPQREQQQEARGRDRDPSSCGAAQRERQHQLCSRGAPMQSQPSDQEWEQGPSSRGGPQQAQQQQPSRPPLQLHQQQPPPQQLQAWPSAPHYAGGLPTPQPAVPHHPQPLAAGPHVAVMPVVAPQPMALAAPVPFPVWDVGEWELPSPEQSPRATAHHPAPAAAAAFQDVPPHPSRCVAAHPIPQPGPAAVRIPSAQPTHHSPFTAAAGGPTQPQQQYSPVSERALHPAPPPPPLPQHQQQLLHTSLSPQRTVPLSEWEASTPPGSPRWDAQGEGSSTPEVMIGVGTGADADGDTPDHWEGEGFRDLLDGQGFHREGTPATPDLNLLDLPPLPPHLLDHHAQQRAAILAPSAAHLQQHGGGAQQGQQRLQQYALDKQPGGWDPPSPVSGAAAAGAASQPFWGPPQQAAPPQMRPAPAPQQVQRQQQQPLRGSAPLQDQLPRPASRPAHGSLPPRALQRSGASLPVPAPVPAATRQLERSLSWQPPSSTGQQQRQPATQTAGGAAAAARYAASGGSRPGSVTGFAAGPGSKAVGAAGLQQGSGGGRGMHTSALSGVRPSGQLPTSVPATLCGGHAQPGRRERQALAAQAAIVDAVPVGKVGAARELHAASLAGLKPSGHSQLEHHGSQGRLQ